MLFASGFYDCRNTNSDAIIRNVAQHDSVSTDQHIVTDLDGAEELRSGPNIDVVADNWSALFLDAAQADHNSVPDATIIADPCIAADNDSAKMIDDKIISKLHFAGKIYPSYNLYQFVQYAIDKRKDLPENGRTN